MKKIIKNTIIAGLITPTFFALASEYLVVIEKEKFLVGGGEPTYSPWISKGTTCFFDKVEDDVYYGYDFTQKESCTETQERTKTIYLDDGSQLKETESQELITESELELVGTYLLDQCSSISGTSYDYGNGYYTLDRNDKKPDVYCDMSDGGWTFYLIPLNSKDDWKNINWMTGWTPSPGFGHKSYADINNECQNETGMDAYADYTSDTTLYWLKARTFLKNETNWFSSHQIAGDGGGIALGLKWTGTNWVNMKGGATSILSADSLDQGDTCNGEREPCGFWDAKDNNDNYGYGAGAEDWRYSSNTGVLCGGKL